MLSFVSCCPDPVPLLAGYRNLSLCFNHISRPIVSRRMRHRAQPGEGQSSRAQSKRARAAGPRSWRATSASPDAPASRTDVNGNSEFFKALVIVLLHLLFGTIALVVLERWAVIDALYYAVVTATTVGYGDVVPVRKWSKVFVSVYAVVSIGLIGGAMGRLVERFLTEGTRRLVHGESDAKEKLRVGEKKVIEAWMGMIGSLIAWGTAVLVGAGLYGLNLGLSWVDALYFVVASVTTVGWGDLHPRTRGGKMFAAAWLVVAADSVLPVHDRAWVE